MSLNVAKLVILKIVGRVLLAFWNVVWKALVIIGLLISIATGGIQLAEKQGIIESATAPIKAAITLPEDVSATLKVLRAAAEKYCAEGGCPSLE